MVLFVMSVSLLKTSIFSFSLSVFILISFNLIKIDAFTSDNSNIWVIMRVASLDFFFLGNWSHFPGSSLLGNFGYWVVPTLDTVRIFWKYFICLFVYTINQSSLAQIANSVSPSVRGCSHLIFIFRDCYGSLGLSCTCQLRREPWHCGKIPFPALSSSGFSSSLQLHVLWPRYPDSFGQNTGFLLSFNYSCLHHGAAPQVGATLEAKL